MSSIITVKHKIKGEIISINITTNMITIRVILKHIKNTKKDNITMIIDNNKIIFIHNIKILKNNLMINKIQITFHF